MALIRFKSLIHERRFAECEAMAMQFLGADGQTTREDAACHYAIFLCLLGAGNLIGAVRKGEATLTVALAVNEPDLAGQILARLVCAYGRLRRYRQQEQTFQRFLDLLPSLDGASNLESRIQRGLALTALRLGDFPHAIGHAVKASVAAETAGDPRAQERCRHLLRMAHIKMREFHHLPDLLAQTREYIATHPDDQPAIFSYWYDLAEHTLESGQPEQAVLHLLQALQRAQDGTESIVACYFLLHRCAAARGEWPDALAFALFARLTALDGLRYDLSHEALVVMSDLLCTHGAVLLDGLGEHFAASGVNPFRFLPTLPENSGAKHNSVR